MVPAELQKYVAEQRQAGVADAVLHDALLASGWQREAVEEALKPAPMVAIRLKPHRLLFVVVVAGFGFLVLGVWLAYRVLGAMGRGGY